MGYPLIYISVPRIGLLKSESTNQVHRSSSLTTPSSISALSLQGPSLNSSASAPQLPWRRANVRHTSNEIYVDIIESLSVLLAPSGRPLSPSGRPLSAFANGTIACTSKLSGVPDLQLTLSCPGGRSSIEHVMELPVFHPCVRLARWREKPGVLSFVPPDGRFVLAGYEVDLLPLSPSGRTASSSAAAAATASATLHLPVSMEMLTGLGPAGADFEVHLSPSTQFPGSTRSASPGGSGSGSGGSSLRTGLGSRLGTSSPALGASAGQPSLEDIVVHIPLPPTVRNVTDLRASRGQAHYMPTEGVVEWHCPSKEPAKAPSKTVATLRCTVVGQVDPAGHDDDDDDAAALDNRAQGGVNSATAAAASTYAYDEAQDAYQSAGGSASKPQHKTVSSEPSAAAAAARAVRGQNSQRLRNSATLMPSAATVSFQVRNWLPSGIKVESLVVNNKTSRGAGESVRPYKGVKYLCASRKGCELRC